MIVKAIEKQVTIVDCEVLRHTCRFFAKWNRKNGNYDRTKQWNDLAYKCDCMVTQIKG